MGAQAAAMTEDSIIQLEGYKSTTAHPVIQLVDGPRPYIWIGDDHGVWGTLDIPPAFGHRVRALFRDLEEQAASMTGNCDD
jgi:hypothetical protein